MKPEEFTRRLPKLTTKPLSMHPPFVFNGVSARVFPLRANLDTLQQFCDGYLNLVVPEAAGRFRATVPYVYLAVLDYGQMAEAVMRGGWFSQTEVLFSVPVEWYKRVKGRWVFHDWAVTTPYIFVDDDFSVPLGRLVFGFPKILARIALTESRWIKNPAAPVTLARIETGVFPEVYSGRGLEKRKFLEIERNTVSNLRMPFDADSPATPWAMASNLAQAIAGFGRDTMRLAQAMRINPINPGTDPGIFPAMLARMMPSFAPGGTGFIQNSLNLKQFRRADCPSRICYQALTNGPMQTTAFNGGGLLGEGQVLLGDLSGGHTVRLYEHSSLPIERTLGLEVHRSGRGVSEFKPVLPFWIDVDLKYQQGATVAWRTDDGLWKDETGAAFGPVQEKAKSCEGLEFNSTVASAIEAIAGPFTFTDTTIRVIPLLAEKQKLQKFLDSYLNEELKSPFEYEIEEIEGIELKNAEKLMKAGIKTTNDLLRRCRTHKGRQEVSAKIEDEDVDEDRLLEWANMSDLMRIGVGPQFAELLVAAGVASPESAEVVDAVAELHTRNPENLTAKMKEINEDRNPAPETPSLDVVTKWVKLADQFVDIEFEVWARPATIPYDSSSQTGHTIATTEGFKTKNARLLKADIKTTLDLMRRCATDEGLREVSAQTGVNEPKLLGWAKVADLMRIKDLTYAHSKLLVQVLYANDDAVDDSYELGGPLVNAVEKLREWDSEELWNKMEDEDLEVEQVKSWIEQAEELVNGRFEYKRIVGDSAYVYLTVSSFGGVTSETNNVGDWAKYELAFMIPVRCKRGGKIMGVGLVPAFTFVENAIAAISRVEVQGIPAVTADFQRPEITWLGTNGELSADPQEALLRMDAEVFRALGQAQKATIEPVIEIRRCALDAGLGNEPDRPWKWAQTLRNELNGKKAIQFSHQGNLRVARALALELLGNQTPFAVYTLKQFRDVRDPDKACYQALLRVPRKLTDVFEVREVEETLAVRIHDYPSLNIVETLGIHAARLEEEDASGIVYSAQGIRPFYIRATVDELLAERLLSRSGTKRWTLHPKAFDTILSDDGKITVDRTAASYQNRGDPSRAAATMLQARRRKEAGERKSWDGFSLEEARSALAVVDPQTVIESVLSREWGNCDPNSRWQKGRKELLKTLGALPQRGDLKVATEWARYRLINDRLAAPHGAVAAMWDSPDAGWRWHIVRAVNRQAKSAELLLEMESAIDTLAALQTPGLSNFIDHYEKTFKKRPENPEAKECFKAGKVLVKSMRKIQDLSIQGVSKQPSRDPSEIADRDRLGDLLEVLKSQFYPEWKKSKKGSLAELGELARAHREELREAIVLARRCSNVQFEALLNQLSRAYQKPDFCIRRDAVGPAELRDELLPRPLSWDRDWYYGPIDPDELWV